MNEEERKARLEAALAARKKREDAKINAINANSASDERRKIKENEDEIRRNQEIADDGFFESHSRGLNWAKDTLIDPTVDLVSDNALATTGGVLGTLGAGEVLNFIKYKSDQLNQPSGKVHALGDALDNTSKLGAGVNFPRTTDSRTGRTSRRTKSTSRHGHSVDSMSQGLNANPETKQHLKDFQKQLKAEGINYDDLKKHDGSISQKIAAEFKAVAEKKYSTLAQKIPTGKKMKKTGLWGAGLTGAAATGLEIHNILTSFGAAEEAKEAQKFVAEGLKKIPGLERDYNIANKAYVDEWISGNTEDHVDYGRYKKLQQDLEGLIK